MKEVEVKYYIGSRKEADLILDKIDEIKAEFIKEREEVDVYFNVGSRESIKLKECLRVRLIKEGADEKVQMTYKPASKNLEEVYFAKEELDLYVDNFEIAQEFLQKLGHNIITTVKKLRRYYKIEDCTITIDKLLDLGVYYIELEIQTDSEKEGVKKLQDYAGKLQLSEKAEEIKPYRDILLQHKNEESGDE